MTGGSRLPASLCRALGLSNGDRLAAELADGALALHPVARRAGQDQPTTHLRLPPSTGRRRLRPLVMPCPPGASREGRGRALLPSLHLPPRREALVTPEPETAAEPVVRREPWILRKKADLLPRAGRGQACAARAPSRMAKR